MVINVPIIKNGVEYIAEEQVYNIETFPFNLYNHYITSLKRGKYYVKYIEIPCAFDIETTTIKKAVISKINNCIIERNKDGDPKFYGEGFMYHWQFCLDKYVIFGRTWEEFILFMKKLYQFFELSEYKRLVIYVHNLSYEFQFIKDFFKFTSIFAREPHKVIKAVAMGFEFRCSYYLSNMSLSKFCENTKNVIHYKLVDTYDYKKIRTPFTKMKENELSYCYNDVRGLCECISELMKEDTLATIPLTSTGYVRREYEKAVNFGRNRILFQKIALTKDQYILCKKIFRGGNTHANRLFTGKILKNVNSYDISSSYPAVIEQEYFPVGKFSEISISARKELDYYIDKYCVIMTVEFFNISVKKNNPAPYIDLAHCEKYGGVINDNGRILKADYIKISITEIDFKIIENTYNIEEFNINIAYSCSRGKLPFELREKLMSFFTDKTKLKNIPDKEYEYMKSKNRTNSSFGMMVTAIDHDNIELVNNEWIKTKDDIQTALDKYYSNKKSFLAYQWGVYVTAHARKRLQDMIDIIGMDLVYIDTDSIKYINNHDKDFIKKNKELYKIADNNDIKNYVVINGKHTYMGIWEHDAEYLYFKTLGAKKYCYNIYNKKTNMIEFHITVAGMSKNNGATAIKCMSNFKIGNQYTNIGRTIAWYNNSEIKKININGDEFITASNVGILDTTYKIGITDEYFKILEECQGLEFFLQNYDIK